MGKPESRGVMFTLLSDEKKGSKPVKYHLQASSYDEKHQWISAIAAAKVQNKAAKFDKTVSDELKKKEEKGKVDKKKAEAELNATLANLTLPPKSTEPWDIDPGGLPAPGGGPELVVVHRSNLAYVGVEFRAV